MSLRIFSQGWYRTKKTRGNIRSQLLFPGRSGRGNARVVVGIGRMYGDYPYASSFLKCTLFSGFSSAFFEKNFEP